MFQKLVREHGGGAISLIIDHIESFTLAHRVYKRHQHLSAGRQLGRSIICRTSRWCWFYSVVNSLPILQALSTRLNPCLSQPCSQFCIQWHITKVCIWSITWSAYWLPTGMWVVLRWHVTIFETVLPHLNLFIAWISLNLM